jgi:hypothetical protein
MQCHSFNNTKVTRPRCNTEFSLLCLQKKVQLKKSMEYTRQKGLLILSMLYSASSTTNGLLSGRSLAPLSWASVLGARLPGAPVSVKYALRCLVVPPMPSPGAETPDESLRPTARHYTLEAGILEPRAVSHGLWGHRVPVA